MKPQHSWRPSEKRKSSAPWQGRQKEEEAVCDGRHSCALCLFKELFPFIGRLSQGIQPKTRQSIENEVSQKSTKQQRPNESVWCAHEHDGRRAMDPRGSHRRCPPCGLATFIYFTGNTGGQLKVVAFWGASLGGLKYNLKQIELLRLRSWVVIDR